MIGREDVKENDLFFTCSLLEYIARKTKNKPSLIVNALGKNTIEKIYELADVYHSDNIEKVSDDFIEEHRITTGDFDSVARAKYLIPTHFDIGKIYKRLILGLEKEKKISRIDALFFAYNSPLTDKINDYNSAFYYDSPQNILRAFLGKDMLERAVTVTIDRPIGSKHPTHDFVYPINYGYVKGIFAGDGEEQDAYVIDVDKPVTEFFGQIVAIIKRKNDVEEKWVVSPINTRYTEDEIKQAVLFQEQYFDFEILM